MGCDEEFPKTFAAVRLQLAISHQTGAIKPVLVKRRYFLAKMKQGGFLNLTRLICLDRPGGTSLPIILFILQIARLHSLEQDHTDGSQSQHGRKECSSLNTIPD